MMLYKTLARIDNFGFDPGVYQWRTRVREGVIFLVLMAIFASGFVLGRLTAATDVYHFLVL